LTSDLPTDQPKPADRNIQNQDPVTLRAFVTKTSGQAKPPDRSRDPPGLPSPLPETHKQQVHKPATASPRPPPAHPFSNTPQCQTATLNRPKTREPPSPITGLGDPLRPAGACRQSKERCSYLHGPAFAGGCRLATARGPYLGPGIPTVQSKTLLVLSKLQNSVD